MKELLPKVNRNFLLLVLLSIFNLLPNKVQAAPNLKLSDDELRQIFGEEISRLDHSLIWPRTRPQRDSRRARRQVSHSNASLFEFDAFGRKYTFKLKPVEGLISPHFVMLRRDGADSNLMDWKDRSGCAFEGVGEEGDEESAIAIVMCGHLRGVVTVGGEELVIEPVPEGVIRRRRRRRGAAEPGWRGAGGAHMVYRRRRREGQCPLERRDPSPSGEAPPREYLFSRYAHAVLQYFPQSTGRQKGLFSNPVPQYLPSHDGKLKDTYDTRSETFYIETAVFVDRDLLQLMKVNFPSDTEEQVIEVVLAMVNAVQLLYNDPSLGHKIKYVLKRLELLYRDPPGLTRPHDIDDFLTKFCLWQNLQNPPSDENEFHWDHALILTGLDLYTIMEGEKLNSQVVGLAPVAGMCTKTSSCTVNEGRHFESVYVVAHEIGHNLGMRHDGLQSGNNCDPSGYLMSPTLGSGKVTWSHCSKRYLNNFLRLDQAKCIEDQPETSPARINHEGPLLPGQRFSSDQQCMLKNGVGSRASFQQMASEVCGDLHCIKDGYTWTSHPALEGTACGPSHWCRKGECAQVSTDFPPPHHSFSSSFSSSSFSSSHFPLPSSAKGHAEPDPWSACKSPCLYGQDGILSSGSAGVARSKIQCNSCHDDYRYKICSGVRQCKMREKKTLQDYAEEMCTRLMREDPALSGYAVTLPQQGMRRCQVECQRKGGAIPVLTRASFPDATLCHGHSKFPTYCLAGVCTEFRCEPKGIYIAGSGVCGRGGVPSVLLVPDPASSLAAPTIPVSFRDQQISPSISSDIWGPWLPSSDCRFSCMTPSRGIQLVSRSCLHVRRCHGLDRNIQLCNPRERTCDEVQTTFKYASEVCYRYSQSVTQLSGIGMQLSSTPDDPNRSCSVACQDDSLQYRFYRVTGRDGWFPFGTECASKSGHESVCLNGKCLEFNSDGTPLRRGNEGEEENPPGMDTKSYRSIAFSFSDGDADGEGRDGGPGSSSSSSSFSSLSSPLVKQIGEDVRESHWRLKRNLKTTSHRVPGSLQDRYLETLVHQMNKTFWLPPSAAATEEEISFVDLANPLFQYDSSTSAVSETRKRNLQNGTSEKEEGGGSEYRWNVTNPPCSVGCGETETIWQVLHCVDKDEQEVDLSYCPPPSPQLQSATCLQLACKTRSSDLTPFTHPFGKWLIGVVEGIKQNQK